MGFLIKDLRVSMCDVDELKLAIIILHKELNLQAMLMGNALTHGRCITRTEYYELWDELAQYEGLLYLRRRERLVYRWPENYEWKKDG